MSQSPTMTPYLDWNDLLQKICSFATSEWTREQLKTLQPLSTQEEALQSVENIFAASEILAQGVRPHMSSLDLYPTWMTRLKKKAVLKTLEIKDVRSFCLESLALKNVLLNEISSRPQEWKNELLQKLSEIERPLAAIEQILTPGGDIRSDASEKLHHLFSEKEKLSRDVQVQLTNLVRDHSMENLLQEKFVTTREGRWVLPIKGGMQHFMPGVIHASSQSKQTVFMEPDKIIPMNNRLRQIENEIEEEIERLLTELSHFLFSMVADFESSKESLEEADFRLAQAQWSVQISAARFIFSSENIDLRELKHPLLVLSGKNVIANSVQLTPDKRLLLLSGPNAGGKTVLLKSIGLAAQMARCGLPLCAEEGSQIPFFKSMIVGIGDSQSVGDDLSTFAAHLMVLQKASEAIGPDHLVLIDEICGSTDPEEGSALARSFIEKMGQQGVFAVITSHLSPLKSGWKPADPIINGSLEYDTKTGRPTYVFLAGVPGESLALLTARRAGISEKILKRAMDFLSPQAKEKLAHLQEIESMKSSMLDMQNHLKIEMHKAQQLKAKYERLVKDFEAQKNQVLEKTVKKAEKKVDEAIAHARVDDTFKKHRSLQEIKYQLPEIVKAKNIVTHGTPSSAEDFGKNFPPGTKIYVPSLQQDGIIQSTPNAKGEVLVLSNSIRLQLPWTELRPPNKAGNPTGQLVRQNSNFVVSLASEDKVLDLRGKTTEEALEELEVTLDRAFQNQDDRIKIIHGHGTEALKKAVRTYLSRSTYVKKWKSGGTESGGDGVTWAEILTSS